MLTLLPIPQGQFSGDARAFRDCIMDRFGTQRDEDTGLADAFARDVLVAYRTYWRAALLRPDQHDVYEGRLLARLRVLTGRHEEKDLDRLEPAVRARLRRAGYESEQGRSGPLRDLRLRKGAEAASRGWRDYATCGRSDIR